MPITRHQGPCLGDPASWWNFSANPGWSSEEKLTLKLLLQKYGIGKWRKIAQTGLLPGKLVGQLNGQTQRLLGQQSIGIYSGLQIDIDAIRKINSCRKDVVRKCGLIINQEGAMTIKQKLELRQRAQQQFGLGEQQLVEVNRQVQEIQSKHIEKYGGYDVANVRAPVMDIFQVPFQMLESQQQIQIIASLQSKLRKAADQLEQQLVQYQTNQTRSDTASMKQINNDSISNKQQNDFQIQNCNQNGEIAMHAEPSTSGNQHVIMHSTSCAPAAPNKHSQTTMRGELLGFQSSESQGNKPPCSQKSSCAPDSVDKQLKRPWFERMDHILSGEQHQLATATKVKPQKRRRRDKPNHPDTDPQPSWVRTAQVMTSNAQSTREADQHGSNYHEQDGQKGAADNQQCGPTVPNSAKQQRKHRRKQKVSSVSTYQADEHCDPGVLDSLTQQLCVLGFPKRMVLDALQECDYDVDHAANWLLQNAN